MTRPEGLLVLAEHQIEQGLALTVEQAEVLATSAARLEVRPTTRTGHYDVKAGNVVGVIVAPGLRVFIRPKVPVRRLFYLLTYATRGLTLQEMAYFDEDADLLEAVTHHFVQLLGLALSRGLVRDYAVQTDELHSLRGRMNLMELATRRGGLWPPVPCEFSEHSADTPMNRVLLAATALLRGATSRPDLVVSLGSLASRMDEVALVRFDPSRVPSVSLDRRHAHFEPAVRLAELVLRHMSMEFRAGSVSSTAFLVDMNLLYERFVVAAIERYLGPHRSRWSRHPRGLYLDEDRELRLVPDAILRDERHRPVVVVDAKYKSVDGTQREDIFQMSTYCSRLDIQHAVLVYAATDEGRHRLHGGVTIYRYPLDIDGDIDTLEQRIAGLTTFIRSLAS